MKNIVCLFVFALTLQPVLGSSQVIHRLEDPNQETRSCQSTSSAVHKNGDMVMVAYYGQWRTLDNGSRIQNGGQFYDGCEIESVFRVDENGALLWEIEPDAQSTETLGFTRQDEITSIVAMPNGQSLVASVQRNRDSKDQQSTAAVTLLDIDGTLVWRKSAVGETLFSMATPIVSPSGEIFVALSFTNYAYVEKTPFQWPGGKRWKPRKNQLRSLAIALDKDGGLRWEKPDVALVSADSKYVLAYRFQYRSKSRTQQFTFSQLDSMGKSSTLFATGWMPAETFVGAERYGDTIAIMTRQEVLEPNKARVKHRFSNVRFYSMKGKLVQRRKLSDGARLATPTDGAPIRIVSPVECDRQYAKDYSCRTKSYHLLTLSSPGEQGTTTEISLEDGELHYDRFITTSLRDGVWLSALTYHPSSEKKSGRPAVTAMIIEDAECAPVKAKLFVWTPTKAPKKVVKNLKSMF